jgi:hypothetical protein
MGALDNVDAALASHAEPAIALATLRSTAPLVSLLSLIRADASRLAALASCSYRHRNGFDKIVLASPAGGPLKLVLHVWPPRGFDLTDHIHDHRWDFASVVLCGALRLELYAPDADGANYSAMRYRSLPGVGNYELHPRGTMAVSAHASVTMMEGSTYSWASGLLHRAWGLPGQVTATLIVQGPPTRNSTNVLIRGQDAQSSPDGQRRLHRLRADQVDRTLAALTGGNVQAAWGLDEYERQAQPP